MINHNLASLLISIFKAQNYEKIYTITFRIDGYEWLTKLR